MATVSLVCGGLHGADFPMLRRPIATSMDSHDMDIVDEEVAVPQTFEVDGEGAVPQTFNIETPQRVQEDGECDEHVHKFTCKKAFFLLGVLTVIVILVMQRDNIEQGLDAFVEWCGKLGPYSVVMMAVCIAITTLLGIPSCPLFIGAGVVFVKLYGMQLGTGLGIVSACTGVWVGSMLAFLLGRSLLKPMVQKKLEEFKTMVIVNKIIEKEGWKFAFLMRLSPFLPAEVFNYACSVTNMTVPANCLACIGSLPTTAFWVWTSASATASAEGGAESHQNKFLFVGINVAVIILMLLVVRSATKVYHQYADQIEEEEHRQIMKRGKRSVMNDIRQASPTHKVAKRVGAVDVSKWAAAKLRRRRVLIRSTSDGGIGRTRSTSDGGIGSGQFQVSVPGRLRRCETS